MVIYPQPCPGHGDLSNGRSMAACPKHQARIYDVTGQLVWIRHYAHPRSVLSFRPPGTFTFYRHVVDGSDESGSASGGGGGGGRPLTDDEQWPSTSFRKCGAGRGSG